MSPADDVLSEAAELVTSARALMLASATTDVPTERMKEARRLLEDATRMLTGSTRRVGLRRHFDAAAIERTRAGEPWQVFTHNPLGIPLRISVTGDTASASVEPTPLLEGSPGLLHGGFSAAMMDALLSTLVQAQGIRAVTVRLEVEFLAATSLDRPLHLAGRLIETNGAEVLTEGQILRDGEAVVRANGLSIAIPGEPD